MYQTHLLTRGAFNSFGHISFVLYKKVISDGCRSENVRWSDFRELNFFGPCGPILITASFVKKVRNEIEIFFYLFGRLERNVFVYIIICICLSNRIWKQTRLYLIKHLFAELLKHLNFKGDIIGGMFTNIRMTDRHLNESSFSRFFCCLEH